MTKKWNADIMFPTANDYSNRITGIRFAPSNDGHPMLTIDTEVVSPTTKEVGEDIIEITGVKAKAYIMVKIMGDDGTEDKTKTAQCEERFKNFLKSMKIDEKTVDRNNVNLDSLKGKIILTLMESRVDEVRGTPTKAQVEEAKKKGIHASEAGPILKDPLTGKKEIKYWPQIVKIYGLSPNQGGGY